MAGCKGLSVKAYQLTGAFGAIALMLVAVFGFAGRPGSVIGHPGPIVVLTIAFTVAVAWNIGFQFLAYLRSDEYIRERHKFSWLWGGLTGLVVSMPICIFIALGGLHWLDPSIPIDRGELLYFTRGYVLAVLAQAIGAGIAMALWTRAKQ